MIECLALSKRVDGRDVLSGVDLTVRRGERVALLGLNGAGKTTLLRCVLGLARFEGTLKVDGRDPGHLLVRDRMAYVPQQAPRFDVSLTEFLEWFADVRAVDVEDVIGQVEEFGLDLETHGTKRLTELSGGMLQKAVVSLALSAKADVLLLDEPTANLDGESRLRLLRALREVDPATTVIICSHRLDDLVDVADRAVVMDEGRVVYDGSMEELHGVVEDEQVLPLRASPTSGPLLAARLEYAVLRIVGEGGQR